MTKKPKIILISAVVLFIGIFLSPQILQLRKRKSFDEKILFTRYPAGYITETIKVGDFLVTFSFDNPGWQNTDSPNYNSPPIAYLVGDEFSDQIYEINFKTTAITQNIRFLQLDVDGDGRDEIISEWVGHNMGAGGLRGLVIWKLDKQKGLMPLAGYPQEVSGESKNKGLKVKNLKTGQISTFPVTSADYFTDFQLVPPLFKLFFGRFIWDFGAGESRNAPHIWGLRVFKFENGAFVKDKSWNNAEEYLTEEKVAPQDDFQELREIFRGKD